MRGQGETRARAGNKGVEQEEERIGEEKGREDVKGRWGGREEVKARKQIVRQRVFCLKCVAVHIESSQDWPPMQTGVEP